jgi:hypothetical protein
MNAMNAMNAMNCMHVPTLISANQAANTNINSAIKSKQKLNLNLNTVNSAYQVNSLKSFLDRKKRSTSGSSHKYTQSESSATLTAGISHTHAGVNTFAMKSQLTNTSPFSRSNNGKTDRDVSPNMDKMSIKKITSSVKPANTIRTSTPEINKNKKSSNLTTLTSDLKSMFNFSSSKKDKEVKKPRVLEEVVTTGNLNLKKSIANAMVPKIPKSKPVTYRTYSEVPAAYSNSNLHNNTQKLPTSNKLKVLESLKFLNYPKTPNVDVFKNALEKLSQCKALNFVILVEHKKGYVSKIKIINFIKYFHEFPYFRTLKASTK